jgi:hypothetical protein
MADLDTQTLFGKDIKAELAPWPAGYGSYPLLPQHQHTLFGEPALWRTVPWPEGYGTA